MAVSEIISSNLGQIGEKDQTKEKLTIFQSTVTKIVVDYAQVLGIVSSIQINWPIGIDSYGSIISKSVPSSQDAFSIDCFFSMTRGTNDNIFFYKILILNIQPFAFFFFGILFWILWAKIRRQPYGQQFKDNLLVTICLIAYVLQPDLIRNTLQLFQCKNLGSTENPESYLERDLQIRCGSGVHLAWALGIGVPSLVIWLLFPIGLFTRIMTKISHFNDDATINRYHFAFKRYKKEKIYWDLNIALRKTALIVFLVFLSDLYSQIFFSFAVFIFSLHLHYRRRPYLDELEVDEYPKHNINLNDLETRGLMSNCIVLFGALFYIKESTFGVMHGFLMVVALGINALFLFNVVKAFWWMIRIKFKSVKKVGKKVKSFLTKRVTTKKTYIDNKNSEPNMNDDEEKRPVDEEDSKKVQDINGEFPDQLTPNQDVLNFDDDQEPPPNERPTIQQV